MGEALAGRRILIVEDEYFVATEMGDAIRSLGAEVVGPFGRLKPALATARSEALDGAVLDVRLDGDTIDRLADELLARGVPILLTTGYEGARLPAPLRRLPCLRKPFDTRTLKATAERALGAGRAGTSWAGSSAAPGSTPQ